MKKQLAIFITCWLSTTAANVAHAELSVGLGMGSLFGGLGLNLAAKTDHNLVYVAAGCYAIVFSTEGDKNDTCGPAAGWLTESGWNKKAFLGIYGGNVGAYSDRHHKGLFTEERYHADYGAGVSLQYFFKGLTESSFVLGPSLGAGFSDDKTHFYLSFTVGYQF